MRVPLVDALLAAAFLAFVAIEGLVTGTSVDIGPRDIAPNPVIYFLIAVPSMAAIAWRRRLPAVVAAVVVFANMLLNVDGKGSTTLAVVVASYSVGAHARSAWAVAVLPAGVLAGLVMAGPNSVPHVPGDIAAGIVFLLAPWAVGRFVRGRAQETDVAVERVALLEREQAALSAAAAAEERVRLARELHDVVSHSVSVVAVQTQAIRRRLRPDQRREAEDLKAVEATAREAMAELRRLFGVLRGNEGISLAPQPGLAELDRLADQVRATGLDVRVTHASDTAQLQPGVDLAAYRIVQEALTNTIKHAGAHAVDVLITRTPTALDIRVDDDGHGLGDGTGGHGLVGIRERAELYGGRLDVSRSPAGGVRVSAHLPLAVQ